MPASERFVDFRKPHFSILYLWRKGDFGISRANTLTSLTLLSLSKESMVPGSTGPKYWYCIEGLLWWGAGSRLVGMAKWWPSAATATTLSRTRDKHWRSGQETSGSPPTHLSLATQYFSCLIAPSVRDVSVSTAQSSAGTAPNTRYRNDRPCPPRTHKACKLTHIVRFWLARLSSSYHQVYG